jgi:hypothetical protein
MIAKPRHRAHPEQAAPEVTMRFREQFDDAQWGSLQLAPFLVLSGVSGRYRHFGVEEMVVFERWLDEAARAPGALNREVLGSVVAGITDLTADYARYEGTIVSGLTTVGDLLAGQPVPEIDAFRKALILVLGAGMARARGPYGKAPTTEAAQMLTMLDEFLRPGVTFAA